jgi:hypothetical protein
MEHELGLQARVDEDERRFVLPDELVDLRHEQRAGMARQRQRLIQRDHADVGPRAALHNDEIGKRDLPSPPLRGRVAEGGGSAW